MVKLSILIPIYNVEKDLNNCIMSILMQKFEDFNILCLDMGSTDNSLNILNRFSKKDSRVKVFSNFNQDLTIINEYLGEYLCLFDAHGWFSSDAFEILYSTAKNNNLDCLMFNNNLYYEDVYFELDESNNFNHYVNKIFNLNNDKNILFDLPLFSFNKLISKDFLIKQGIEIIDIFHKYDDFICANSYYFDFSIFFKILLNSNNLMFIPNEIYTSSLKLNEYSIFNKIYSSELILNYFINNPKLFNQYNKELLMFLFDNLMNGFNLLSNLDSNHINQIKDKFLKYLRIFFDKLHFDYKLSYDLKEYLNKNQFEFFNKFIINKGDYRFSIIIPVFNLENHLEQSLDSIINQTIDFNTIEVIIVDDASTDNSPSLIKEYSNKYSNIKSIFLNENSKYAGKPRNIALNYVSSNYVSFLDGDDFYYKDACKNLYFNMIKEQSQLTIGNFTRYNFDKSLQNIIDAGISGYVDDYSVIKFDSILNHEHILKSNNVWNKLFLMDIIQKNNIKFTEGIPAQDSVFLFHYLACSRDIVFINNLTVHYNNLRLTDDDKSVTHLRNNLNLFGRLESYKHMYNLSLKYDIEEKFIKYILIRKLNYLSFMLLQSKVSNKEFKNLIEKYGFLFKKSIPHKNIINEKYLSLFISISEENLENTLIEFNKLTNK